MGKQKAKREVAEPLEHELEGVLAALKRLGKPSTSREVSDGLGIKNAENGRAYVRRVMAKLQRQGKVKVAKEGREFSYSLP